MANAGPDPSSDMEKLSLSDAPKQQPGFSLEKGGSLSEKEGKALYTKTGAFNTWYPGLHAPTFEVRREGYCVEGGANLGKKSPSAGFLYDVFDVDFIKTPRACRHISRSVDLARIEDIDPVDGIPGLFVLNFFYPAPGGKPGEHNQLVFYARLSAESRRLWSTDPEKAPRSLHFLKAFTHSEEGSPLRKRFKCISRVTNPDESLSGFTWFAVRQLIKKFNAKPFLAKDSFSCHKDPAGKYFEVNVDVNKFSMVARSTLGKLTDKCKEIIWDFGFVLEGHRDDELPEQMLFAARLSKMDPKRCPVFNPAVSEGPLTPRSPGPS